MTAGNVRHLKTHPLKRDERKFVVDPTDVNVIAWINIDYSLPLQFTQSLCRRTSDENFRRDGCVILERDGNSAVVQLGNVRILKSHLGVVTLTSFNTH